MRVQKLGGDGRRRGGGHDGGQWSDRRRGGRDLLVGVAGAQTPKADPVKPAAAAETAKPADALSAMIADARTAHAKTRDYSGTYTRQERMNGTLSRRAGRRDEVPRQPRRRPRPLRQRPDSDRGHRRSPTRPRRRTAKSATAPPARRAAGVSGSSTSMTPSSSPTIATPVTQWGMGPLIELIASTTAREKSLNNPVEVFSSDYQFDKRNVTKYEIYTRRPHAARYAAKMVVFIDKETKLPVRFEAYGDAKPGATTGELLEAYSFTNLKFNSGIGENAFVD